MPSSSRKIIAPQAPTTSPKLKVPHTQAQEKLESHIAKGQEILARPTSYTTDIDKANADGETWREYAIRLLASMFDTTIVADEFSNQTRRVVINHSQVPHS